MAVFNGEAYMRQQIDSILCQLEEQDELVISIDPSADASQTIAADYAARDTRISVLEGPGRGAIQNFENALNHAAGQYIFLSDQDDIWQPNKREECLDALEKDNVLLALHDAYVTDENLLAAEETFFNGVFSSSVLKNIVRNRYIGCCMAFKRELLNHALPFPKGLPMHDQWLGLTAKKFGEVAFVNKPLICYRRHGETVTGRAKSGILTKIRWRINITMDYIKLCAKG